MVRLSRLAMLLGVSATASVSADPEPWSSPDTWGGALPVANTVVTIPAGSEVLLDIDPPDLNGLIVEGHLLLENTPLKLTSRWILIDGGILSVGSAEIAHTNEVLITLTGTDEDESIAAAAPRMMGTKMIGVINGGRLELHGTRSQSRNWTLLDGHARKGATQLRVVDAVDWTVGDRLVIAPSGFDPNEAEEVTVTAVADDLISFAPALQHDHWGELQVIEGHEIDERAEVACLTRNIVIRGDEASEQSDFGGHLMFAPGTEVHIEGVEFFRMGQKGHAGRYPIHWHMAGDRRGDIARGNSVHHSYHRAIVVHGTSNVLVEGNVSYDVWSHAYVPSEDGTERGNRFVNNLGMLTQRLALQDYAFPVDVPGGTVQAENRPAAFWMRSPDQQLIGNHAAGVVNGMGFMFDGPGRNERWSGTFSGNTAHACSGPSGTAADRYPGLTVGYGLFMEQQDLPKTIRFDDFTAYKNTLAGLWLEAPGQRARRATLADNGTGAILTQSTLEDSVIVGQSDNTIGTLPGVGTSLTGGVHLVAGDALKAPQLRNIDFINQRDAGIVMLGTRLHPLSRLENLRFFETAPCLIDRPTQMIGGFTDVEGCLVGDGVPAFVHGRNQLGTISATVFNEEINAWVTPLSALQFVSLTDMGPEADDLGFTVLASDTVTGELSDTGLAGGFPERSAYVVKNAAFTTIRFDPLPDGIRVSVGQGDGGSVLLEFSRGAETHVYGETRSALDAPVPDFGKALPMVENLNLVTSATTTAWYGESESQTIHLRLEAGQTVYLFGQENGGLELTSPEDFWISRQFGYHVVSNPDQVDIWDTSADPDGDGVENLREYFHGTNPVRSDDPVVFDPRQGRLSFKRDPEATGLDYAVFCSSDLVTWNALTEIEESFQPDGQVRVLAAANRQIPTEPVFMFLEITQTTP